MKRVSSLIVALLFVTASGCAEQPGKKKEDETKEGKVETKPIDGSKPEVKAEEKK